MLSLLALAGLLFPPLQESPSESPVETITEDAVRTAWTFLHPDEKHEIAEWFRAECGYMEGFQAGLLSYLLDNQERDPGTWPEETPPDWYECEKHAPAQVIPRFWTETDSRAAQNLRKRIFEKTPVRKLVSAWRYDYATLELKRDASINQDEQIFENGIHGFAPDVDLAEALVEMKLDDASLRPAFQAFAHAYTDRSGRAYPGVTLYDAWASGAQIEMPDVDTLGIIHDLDNEWKKWRAPVPGPKQEPLYERIAEHFVPLRTHRGLRNALARTYLSGSPVVQDGYATGLDRLHYLWEEAVSTPGDLREKLPTSATWSKFLIEADNRMALKKGGAESAKNRRAYLQSDSDRVRQTLFSVMKRFGALDRTALPPRPEPEEPPTEQR